jgi:hypothetical protein
MKKLERIVSGIKFTGILSLYLASEIILGFGNECYQQTKHFVYHLRGINHKKEDCSSDSSFSYYTRKCL